MDQQYYPQSTPTDSGEMEPIHRYTAKTFGWMFLGLLATFAVAMTGLFTGAVFVLFSVPYLPFILLLAELALVWTLSARINKLSVGAAKALFFVYAGVNGIVFSAYFVMYEMWSLIFIFAMTALYFGIMAVFGYVTKSDLSKYRFVLMGGAIFLAVFWLLSMFLNLSGLEVIISFIGVVIFLGFTAYDTQKIKAYYAAYSHDPEMAAKASIFAALQLYLDFINLFLYLLRILGKRR